MILRRVIEHVRAQNWFAVGLDFVIVVVGVFIGIQLGNWNEARSEANQEAEIRAQIAEDIRLDRRDLDEGMAALLFSIEAAQVVIEAVDGQRVEWIELPTATVGALGNNSPRIEVPATPEITDEDRDRLWSFIIFNTYPNQSAAAYESLLNTGKLSIISDSDFINRLQDYRQRWEGTAHTHDGTMRILRNAAIAEGQSHGLSPFTPLPAGELIALVKENKSLAATIRTLLEYKLIHLQMLKKLDQDAVALLTGVTLESQDTHAL